MAAFILSMILPFMFSLSVVSSQICNLDLGIILDESTSITRWGFEQEKNFVKSLTSQLQVSNTNTRISIMTFSTTPQMRVNFRDLAGQNLIALNFALYWMHHRGGWTHTDKALNLAKDQMFNENYGSRKNIPKMLLLLTDGQSQSGYQKLSEAAAKLKNNYVNIISIGVGYHVRRSELELIASSPIHQHVFQVRNAWALSRIVNTVKTEACKPITCWYIHCIYNEWTAWSGTCDRVSRTKSVRQEVRKSKLVVGGCAGLNVLNCKPNIETKDLGQCPLTCQYVNCVWTQWSPWSATCGRASRQRSISTVPATTKRNSCAGLPQTCQHAQETENQVTLCTCNYVDCKKTDWSQWSTTCGRGERRRTTQTIRRTTQRESCNGLTQTCPSRPEVESRTQMCTCNYVDCKKTGWSQWSTTCGRGERQRRIQTNRRTVRRENCNGLTQTCPNSPEVESRTQMCTCNYVECKKTGWSQWSTTCGRGERQRTTQTIRRTTQRESCNGLTQTCPSSPEVESRTKMCTCDYVQCKQTSWSRWSKTCGRGERQRTTQTIRRTTQRESCSGLAQSCPKRPEVESRTQMCTCNFVQCKQTDWSQWSTTCGRGERRRTTQTIRRTTQRESCTGLTQTCPSRPEVESRTHLCQCTYVECKYNAWSAWTTTCGNGKRTRKLQPVQKTKKAISCNGLPQTCSTTPDEESRTTMCTCNYVECNYGPWSQWTTTCGRGERQRKMQATQKTKQAVKCEGLAQSCSSTPDIERRNQLCNCDYVECKYTAWSSWNPICGRNMKRKRTLQTIKKTVQKESCSGLNQTCTGDAEQTEKKDGLCDCDAVKCNMQWSAWSATCGMATRTLRFVPVPIKVKQPSCVGLKKTCPGLTETQVEDLPCPKTNPPNPTASPSSSDVACNTGLKPMGCFKDNRELRETFNKLLFVDQYKKSSIYSFTDYVFDVVCRCATKARADKYSYYAVSSQGHCLAGVDGEDGWRKHSGVPRQMCLNARLNKCEASDSHCIGADDSLFAYKVLS